jgi:uncharacterized DUF497 family protein
MKTTLTWDERKRLANLAKHGLDFAHAGCVLDSRYRLDIPATRGDEIRVMSFSYVMKRLAVLILVHMERANTTRIISYRSASQNESEMYYALLEKNTD